MSLGTLLYIVIIVIAVVANIYKGIKKAAEEQKRRQAENANRPPSAYPTPQPQPQQQPRPRTEPIPDPWEQKKPAPAQRRSDQSRPAPVSRTEKAPKQKSIEEVLQDMMRQYETPNAPTLDKPYSTIDKPVPEVSKNYQFDDSMVQSALSRKNYGNILEEHDVLDKQESLYANFSPREAIKYATLLERKYQ